ncbi:MAG: hypothetical protein R3327_02880 [Nitrosopumilaceae archaeon]|nr:hypothetical protein [Nitrosopumilaceae archaeon]
MKFRRIPPKKLKVIMLMFFGSGLVGIFIGLQLAQFMITTMGVVNLCLGGFFGWLFFTQPESLKDKRKRKRDKK